MHARIIKTPQIHASVQQSQLCSVQRRPTRQQHVLHSSYESHVSIEHRQSCRHVSPKGGMDALNRFAHQIVSKSRGNAVAGDHAFPGVVYCTFDKHLT